MSWREVLGDGSPFAGMFDAHFLQRSGSQRWAPNDDDRKAAAKLHTQIASRITTQRLPYLGGVEKRALESIYSLFEKTREIGGEHVEGRHFDAIVWEIFNRWVRPFTAKWHRVSEGGGLLALDETDEFRGELNALQIVLRSFDDLLLQMRDGRPPSAQEREPLPQPPASVGLEMDEPLDWGIPELTGGIDPDPRGGKHPARAISEAEAAAIAARRTHYAIADKRHAVALALSGGGIRSATFSLGVLVALAGRGLLPQFDYLSTVSGGGYLGSFVSAFLSGVKSGDQTIGLSPDQLPFRRKEGEAEALRHLRHHSKYLATGSLWGRVKMVLAQLYGMLLNTLGIAWIALLLALLERTLRQWTALDGCWRPVTLGAGAAWVIAAVVTLLGLRFWPRLQKYADTVMAVPTVVLAGLLAWWVLAPIHSWFERWVLAPTDVSWIWNPKTWIAVAGALPVITSALTGFFGRFLKRLGPVLIALSAIAAPLFFFALYLFLYAAVAQPEQEFVFGAFAVSSGRTWWEIVLVGTIVYFILLDINFTSPHRHYRNKLAEAYLIRPAKKRKEKAPFEEAVTVRLSDLGAKAERAPYHLINCALNVPGSKDPRMQGRLADFFLFSPEFCGSPLTGYARTGEWEKFDWHLDLGTAMAISGAAAAPQMGLGTMKRLSFWLALLNVRLGYWVRKPGRLAWFFGGAPGLTFLLKEMRGSMNERLPWLNVSDGGHIENLGVYELLRRRCKYIVAIDGEQDPKMTFHALTTLQRLAFIDLGVRIDVDLDDLRLNERGLSRSHFRFCRIRYPKGERGSEEEYGYLLYLKLSLTGNEGEFIRRYRLDEPVFPHHSTADQFFSETQFEAYRALGEHVGNKLFLRAIVGDQMADSKSVKLEDWFRVLGENLLEPRPMAR